MKNKERVYLRLSLKRGKLDDGRNPGRTISMPKARSFVVFPWAVDQIVALRSFKVLRVLKRGKLDDGRNPGRTTSMPKARSFLVFLWVVDQIVALENFKVLRVLDLQSCYLSTDYRFEYLSNLFHLRYLNLRSSGVLSILRQ